MTVWELHTLLPEARNIARDAGKLLMSFYDHAGSNPDALKIRTKDDETPITIADEESHNLIYSRLETLTPGISIISEENEEHPEIKSDGLFWSVDPLDGTKEFIAETGGFAVKIALLDRHQPVLGVVYAPAFNTMYYSIRSGLSYKKQGTETAHIITTQSSSTQTTSSLSTLFNEKHACPKVYQEARTALQQRGLPVTAKPDGTANLPRNLRIAEGLADIFIDSGMDKSLKNGCGYSWDYAPDWLILKNAGGVMTEIISGEPPQFLEPTSRMHAYVAFSDKKLGKRVFPELKKHC